MRATSNGTDPRLYDRYLGRRFHLNAGAYP